MGLKSEIVLRKISKIGEDKIDIFVFYSFLLKVKLLRMRF